jgi:HD-like signal output (HDOD) protein
MNQELANRIRQCPNLPSLPAVAVQVLDLAQRADVDITEIARTISKDPALSGKLLKTTNSSFYGRSKQVSAMNHALVILGLQSVKTLVLGFSLVSSLTNEKAKGFNHLDYWKRSIYGATAARFIAAKLKLVQQEEAFLASLLKDIGMLILDRVLGEEYGKVCEKVSTHGQLLVAEREALKTDHAEVGGFLAGQWKLPPLLSVPISFHHEPAKVTDPTLKKLTELVNLAGLCADVFVEESAAQSLAQVHQGFKDFFKVTEGDCNAWMKEIGRNTREAAQLFEINLGSSASFDDILKKANEALVELTLRSQRQVNTLQQQNTQLKNQATIDPLTGLANR